jgi:hypothetical protein
VSVCHVTSPVADDGATITGAGIQNAAALDRIAAPAQRRAAGAVTGLWAVVLLAALAGTAMTIVARNDLAAGDLASNLGNAVAAAAYATLGALIVRRAGNVIGWIMLGEGAGLAFLALASIYAVIGIATFPGILPAAKQVGTLAECSFPAIVFITAFMFLFFPTGTLPSRRWRPVAAAGLLLTGLTTAGLVVHPRLVALPAVGGVSLAFPNPLAVENLGPVLRTVLIGTINGLSAAVAAFLAAAFVSLAVRYRAGDRLLRQQVKWLALTAVAFAADLLIALLAIAAGQPWLTTVAYTTVQLLALLGIPAAMTIAILKHRLYEIDVIINRAIRYGLLSAALTAIYVLIVVGTGRRPATRAARCSTPGRRWRSRCCSSRCGGGRSWRRTGLCTGSGPLPIKCCRTSRRTWRASWTPAWHWRRWRRSWPPPPARSAWRFGSGSGRSCARR